MAKSQICVQLLTDIYFFDLFIQTHSTSSYWCKAFNDICKLTAFHLPSAPKLCFADLDLLGN